MSELLTIRPGDWLGWQELPLRYPGWGATPVLVTAVQPLQGGQGLLRLRFVHLLHPREAVPRTVDLQVLRRHQDHLAGEIWQGGGKGGAGRSVLLGRLDYAWVESFCPALLRCRPPRHPTMLVNGQKLPELPPTTWCAQEFGGDEAAALHGARVTSFGNQHPPLPDRQAVLPFAMHLQGFAAWLAARGFVPQEMEEKWFIHRDGDALLFRRSWTGLLIYRVAMRWDGDALLLGPAQVNRDPAQYKASDDAQDEAQLRYLVTRILLGLPAEYPIAGGDAGTAAIRAWAAVGKALG